MTDKEKAVIQWAFNLTDAIVAGDYRMPEPMNVAINSLQDAVFELATERGMHNPKEGCSKEFLEREEKFWHDVENSIKAKEQLIVGDGA